MSVPFFFAFSRSLFSSYLSLNTLASISPQKTFFFFLLKKGNFLVPLSEIMA